MNSNEIYRKKFEKLYLMEDRFVNLYKYNINRVRDPNILDKLKQIYGDEKKHCEIVKGFIDKIKESGH